VYLILRVYFTVEEIITKNIEATLSLVTLDTRLHSAGICLYIINVLYKCVIPSADDEESDGEGHFHLDCYRSRGQPPSPLLITISQWHRMMEREIFTEKLY